VLVDITSIHSDVLAAPTTVTLQDELRPRFENSQSYKLASNKPSMGRDAQLAEVGQGDQVFGL